MMLLGELCITKGNLQIKGRIGYVPQQAWIFSGSVRQNIVFGQTFEADRYDNVIKACSLKKVKLLPWSLLISLNLCCCVLVYNQLLYNCISIYFSSNILSFCWISTRSCCSYNLHAAGSFIKIYYEYTWSVFVCFKLP